MAYRYEIKVQDASTSSPLINAYILCNGKVLGQTNADGNLVLEDERKAIEISIIYPTYNRLDAGLVAGRIYVFRMIRSRKEIHETVTASIKPEPVVAKSVRVYSIDKHDIERSPDLDPSLMLQSLLGASISSYYGEGGQESVHINNSSNRQVLVLLNDIPLNDPFMGGFDVSLLDLGVFDKIEMCSAGLSDYYGQAASSGVLNLLTSSDYIYERSLKYSVGSYGYMNTSLDVGEYLGRNWYIRIKPFLRSVRNDYPYTDFFGEERELSNNKDMLLGTLFENIIFLDKTSRLNAFYGYLTDKKGSPGTDSNPQPTAFIENTMHIASLGYLYSDYNRVLKGTLYYENTYFHYNNMDGYKIDNERRQNLIGLNLKEGIGLSRYFTLLSIQEARQAFINAADIDKDKEAGGAVSAGLDLKYKALYSEFLLRLDKNEGRDLVLAPGLSLALRGDDTSISFKAARGFTYPNLTDLYWPKDNFAVGNPELKPEYSWNFGLSLGAERFDKALNLELNPFYTTFTDQIKWLPAQKEGRWSPVNLTKSRSYGVNISTSILPLREFIRLKGNGSFCRAEVIEDDTTYTSIYSPSLIMNAGIEIGLERLFVKPCLRYKGKVYTKPNSDQTLPERALYDIEAVSDLGRVVLSTGIYNLLNKRYQDMDGYPAIGREWRISMRLDLLKELSSPLKGQVLPCLK